MADVTPFPFATVEELKQRWPDFPTGGEAAATVALEDASQFILDVCSGAANASASTRRRSSAPSFAAQWAPPTAARAWSL
ncbi:hypothetical protein SAMN04489745_3622 [Arthrobacter woluwensis]|uniref:Uncharacterized protein n=1 Tax=Arthrobacter woluwensis TaxID=156980 RepID=A0A1H4X1H5_9MICC|nr:hypothetical protein SAMN04489745_3622 [Arthrobacter woluwensis]